jgi:hypothetical protein
MKKYLIGLLGALSLATPQTMAYKLDVIASENIAHQEALLDKLEKYEAASLTKLAAVLKDTKIDPESMVTLGLSLDGSIHSLNYRDPGAAIAADSPERKALLSARTIQFGKIPSLESGYIKITLPFKELMEGNYQRKLYVVKTTEGQSIGGVGGINIGGVIGNVEASPSDVENARRRNVRRQAVVSKAPYTDKDRKFDSEITSIYSSLCKRPSPSSPFDRSENSSLKVIEEQSAKYMQQEYWLAAAQSYLNETKYFLRLSELDKGKERFAKAKDLLGKLELAEKENLIKSTVEASSKLARGNENYSCREYLLLQAYNMAKDQKISNSNLRFDTIQALADFYLSAGQKTETLNYYNELLAATIASKNNPERAAQSFAKIAQAQRSLHDRVSADKTLAKANTYLAKKLGKDSVILIPILIQMMQNTTDSKVQEAKLEHIENIVENYKQAIVTESRSSADQSALAAARALLNESRTADYRKYNDPASATQLNLSAACARLGYKLKLKAESKFDYSAFSQLARAMQAAGQFEQSANLYKETIAMLETSQDRSETHYAESLRGNYMRALEQAGKTDEAAKIKDEIKTKETNRIADIIKKMEDSLKDSSNQRPVERVRKEIGLFGLYANQKNDAKIKDVLEKALIDLKAIDGSARELHSLGFTLVGPIRTQPEFFQADPKMEELLVRTILLFDEKTVNGIDSMAMNTLTLRIVGGDKNELAKKVHKAIDEARQGRGTPPGQSKISTIDEQIDSARSKLDYALVAKLRQEKIDAMKKDKQRDFLVITETFQLSRAYFEAKQMTEAEKAFNEGLQLVEASKPAELARNLGSIDMAISYYSMHKQYNLIDKGLRKYVDLMATLPQVDSHDFNRLNRNTDSLTRAYIQNGDLDKAIEFERYVLNKLSNSNTKNQKLISQAKLSLSLTLLQIANRDSKRKDALMQESEKEFNGALTELTSYYGPKSSQVKRAIQDRMREVKGNDLQALENLKKLQDQN